jgi:hypothetical protein
MKNEIRQCVEAAKSGLEQLTGFSAPHAIGISQDSDVWHVTIEITEKSSEASNLDLLGIYDVRVDNSGNLMGYERLRMRKRCEKDI